MNAKVADIISKIHAAKGNVAAVEASEKYAIYSGLEDDEFKATSTRIHGLLERSTSHVTDVLTNSSGLDFLQLIPFAEENVDKALKESERTLQIMQVAVAAAAERKKAREVEGKTEENEDCEEPRKKNAKGTTKEGEASNKPGGSNA